MIFSELLTQKAFLGRDFLTWLWVAAERLGGRIEAGENVIDVEFMDRMVLDRDGHVPATTITLKGGDTGRQIVTAINDGKKVCKARISITTAHNNFTTTLDADWLGFGSLKIPVILPADGADDDVAVSGEILERVSLFEEGIAAVDTLFKHFMTLRLSDEWAGEIEATRQWITTEAAA